MTKAELRREMRARLKTLGADRAEKSRAICAAVAAHPAFTSEHRVALFSSLPSEPDLGPLWEHGPRKFCYPRVTREHIEYVEIAAPEDLIPATWNPWVLEPAAEAAIIAPAEIGLILVPGLAFSADGWRLGRGGGFYDRFLEQLPARTVKLGVAFDRQIVEALPTELHDQRLDMIVTESGFLKPSR
jgi:5-formyltetrahydrofolate cyclo-ligase